MVLENVKEMWTEVPRPGKRRKKSKPVNTDSSVNYFCVMILLLSSFEIRWLPMQLLDLDH
ncbi:unnamed protein product, partial [Heterobilharzia americana]